MTVTLVHVPVKVCQASWRLGTPATAAASVSSKIVAKIIKTFEISTPSSGQLNDDTTSRSRRQSHSSHPRGRESHGTGSPSGGIGTGKRWHRQHREIVPLLSSGASAGRVCSARRKDVTTNTNRPARHYQTYGVRTGDRPRVRGGGRHSTWSASPVKLSQRYAEMAAPCQINTPLTALSMNVAYSVSSGQCPNAALQAILWRDGLPAERLQACSPDAATPSTAPYPPDRSWTTPSTGMASMNMQSGRSRLTNQARRRMPSG